MQETQKSHESDQVNERIFMVQDCVQSKAVSLARAEWLVNNLIKGGERGLAAITARYRELMRSGQFEMAAALKRTLPAVCFHASKGTARTYMGITQLSGCVVFDIDKIWKQVAALKGVLSESEKQEVLRRAKAALAALRCALLVRTTVSGEGLQCVVPVEGLTRENWGDCWSQLRDYLHSELEKGCGCAVKCDEACKDIPRASYLSHDPEAYYNPAAEAFTPLLSAESGCVNGAELQKLASWQGLPAGAPALQGMSSQSNNGFYAHCEDLIGRGLLTHEALKSVVISDALRGHYEYVKRKKSELLRGDRHRVTYDILIELRHHEDIKAWGEDVSMKSLLLFTLMRPDLALDFTDQELLNQIACALAAPTREPRAGKTEPANFSTSATSPACTLPVLLDRKLIRALPPVLRDLLLTLNPHLKKGGKSGKRGAKTQNPVFWHKVDMQFLSFWGVASALTPGVIIRHDLGNQEVHTNVCILIIAPPASGKGEVERICKLGKPFWNEVLHSSRQAHKASKAEALRWQAAHTASTQKERQLFADKDDDTLTPPEITPVKHLLQGGRITAAGLIKVLNDNGGDGTLYFTSELEDLTGSLRSQFGDFQAQLRQLFEHEPLRKTTATDGTLSVEESHFSLLATGTPNQLRAFTRGDTAENGLLSRIAAYLFEETSIQQAHVPNRSESSTTDVINAFSTRLCQYARSNEDTVLCVEPTPKQWLALTKWREDYETQFAGDPLLKAQVRRFFSLILRLLALLTYLEHAERNDGEASASTDVVVSPAKQGADLVPSQALLNAVLVIGDRLWQHTLDAAQKATGSIIACALTDTDKATDALTELPDDFTTAQLMEQVKKVAPAIKDASVKYIPYRLKEKGLIESTGRGKWRKAETTASSNAA